jgi:hypothetical protein
MASTQRLSRDILYLLAILDLNAMSISAQDKYKRLNEEKDPKAVFLFESCVGLRGAVITTMCFLKAIFEDRDNRR